MRKLLAIPRMRFYFLGNGLSGIGDYALWMAAGIWVKELTGSTAKAGFCFVFLAMGSLLSPLTGLLVDRVYRRPLILITNSATGLMVLSLALVRDQRQLWLIYAVMFLYGVSSTIVSPAMSALLTKLVPADLLGSANGISQALTQSQRLITPTLGVGLLSLYGGGAVAVLDAASFAASVACWSFIAVDEDPPQRSSRSSWRSDTAAGFKFLVKTPPLRQLSIALTAGIFVLGFFETIAIAIATTGLHHAASWTSVIVTAMGVSGITGGLTAGMIMRRLGPGRLAALGLGTTAISALVVSVPSDAVVIGGALLLGLGLPFIIVGTMTAMQINTPNELMGRVNGADNFLVSGGQSLGIATGAALISVLYYRDLCYLAAVVLAGTAIYLATRPEQVRQRPMKSESAAAEGLELTQTDVDRADR